MAALSTSVLISDTLSPTLCFFLADLIVGSFRVHEPYLLVDIDNKNIHDL